MIQKFHENVEISNKGNFCDKIFVITQKDFVILKPHVVLLREVTQHKHNRIASKREMPLV